MTPAAMPQPPADPLAGLRGYHLPDPVGWWPPAPGWWVLALLTLVLLAAGIHWAARRHRRRAAARQALKELARLREGLAVDGDRTAFARGLSRLLRRFALVRFPRREVAGLAGEDWLAFLDATGGGGRFREGPGRLLSEAPYRPPAEIQVESLAALAEDWIGRNREVRP
jgi:hypothetical protein